MNKLLALLLGIFIGSLVTYNLVLNDIVYRISFYGYKETPSGTPLPIVKLRKKIKSSPKSFSILDPGMDIEVATLTFKKMGQSLEFDEKMAQKMIREKYCA